jgi:drug/metabolite transporter (DMT)-like permease
VNAPAPATRLQLALAFLCIYVVWGSTYLAMKFAVATIPPFLMGAVRFLTAGALLVGWSAAQGRARATRRAWRNAAVIGGLLLFVGNGSISWATQRLPSGVVSLLVATVPLWLVVLEGVRGRRPTGPQVAGVVVGLFGVSLLVLPADGAWRDAPIDPLGAALVILSALAWTTGSLFSRTAEQAPYAPMASGLQMLCGGALLGGLSLATGEPAQLDLGQVSTQSALAVAYLIVFGSLVGFSTYMWLLQKASPTAVGIYVYVNPAVAVALGALFAGERLPARGALAMAIIVGSVALVSLAPRLGRRVAEWRETRPWAAPKPEPPTPRSE